jgi:hypothetical protein
LFLIAGIANERTSGSAGGGTDEGTLSRVARLMADDGAGTRA